MRKAIPSITEHAAGLKQRLRREQDSHKQLRLQMLYLLASQQTHERQEVAQLLGVHRNTISRWLAIYVAGGLAALLAPHAPRYTRLARARRARQPRTGAPPPGRPRVLPIAPSLIPLGTRKGRGREGRSEVREGNRTGSPRHGEDPGCGARSYVGANKEARGGPGRSARS
jgi:hypothetical protein